LELAKDMCEKLKRKRLSLVGEFHLHNKGSNKPNILHLALDHYYKKDVVRYLQCKEGNILYRLHLRARL
jgi:hypothetical protein